MQKFDLITFLVVVNIGFLMLTAFLFFYIIAQKYISNLLDERKNKFLVKLEDSFLKLIIENDESEIKAIITKISNREFEYFVEFFSLYITNVKSEDLKKITQIIIKDHLFERICASTRSSDVGVRLYSIYCLGLLKIAESGPYLRNAMNDDNLLIKIIAAGSIARIKDLSYMDEVLFFLAEQKLLTFHRIAEILWEYGDEACPHFLEILQNFIAQKKVSENSTVISVVLKLLGHWKYMESAPVIASLLCPVYEKCVSGHEKIEHCPALAPKTVSDMYIIKSAIEALGTMGYTDAAKCIYQYSYSVNSEVKINCVTAFVELQSDDKIPRMKELLSDDDWNVRYAAASALYKMGYNLQQFLFEPQTENQCFERACRTVVHVLTEKSMTA